MNQKEILDRKWYAPKAISAGFKAIRWLPMKKKGGKGEGLLNKYWKTLIFIGISALLFVGMDALIALVVKA